MSQLTGLTKAEIKRDLRDIGAVKRVPPVFDAEEPALESMASKRKRWKQWAKNPKRMEADLEARRTRREHLRQEAERDWDLDADRRAHYAEVRRLLRTPFNVEELVKLEHVDLDDATLLDMSKKPVDLLTVPLSGRRWIERPHLQERSKVEELRAQVAEKEADLQRAAAAFFVVVKECTASRRAAENDYVRISELRDFIADEKARRGYKKRTKKRRTVDDDVIATPTPKKRAARK